MQQNDDRRRAGRPSLLSDGAPVAEDQSILSKLDGAGANKAAVAAPRKRGRWVAACAAVLVLGGALAWVWQGGDSATDAALATAAPAASGTLAPAPAADAPDEPEVSAAAILDGSQPAEASAAQDGHDELTALLDQPSAVLVKPDMIAAALNKQHDAPPPAGKTVAAIDPASQPDEPEKTVEPDSKAAAPEAEKKAAEPEKKPEPEKKAALPKAAKPVVKAKSEPVKLARLEPSKTKGKPADKAKDKAKDKDKDKAKAKDGTKAGAKDKAVVVASATKKKPAPKAEPKVDSDVALLAALLAHAKAHPPPKVNKTAAEYKRCGTLASVAEADRCRERLCDGSAKAKSECKALGSAKAAS